MDIGIITIKSFMKTQTVVQFVKPLITFLFIIIFCGFIHWSLNYAYNSFCIDYSLYGFLKHCFTLASPFCQFINFVQYEITKNYVQIWITTGVAISTCVASKLLFYSSSPSKQSS